MRQDLVDRRNLAYSLHQWDDVGLEHSVDTEDIPGQVVGFFKSESKLVYPAKSYYVAIVYAKCMEKYFGIDFLSALNDKDLLPDDKYFVPYECDKLTYNCILEEIGDILECPGVGKTVGYFKKEFLIDDIDS